MAAKKPDSVVTLPPIAVPIPQAARILGTTVPAVRQLLRERKILFFKLGKRFVISVDELKRFVEREAAKASAA